MRNLIFSLAVLLLVAPAAYAAGPGERFNELARGFVAHDPESLARIRPALDAIMPGCFKHPMDPGPLRSILARSLPEDTVRDLFRGARADPQALISVTRNLASRPGLGALLVDMKLVPLLAAPDSELVVELGVLSLLDGDSSLATAVVSIPSLTLDMADELTDLERPEGLCFLADVVGGEIPVAAEALALLPLYEPDSWNRRSFRPLDPARIEGLSQVAAHDPDHAVRAFAARLMIYSGTPETFEPAVAALQNAGSARIEPSEWRSLGKWYGRPVLDPAVTVAARYAAFVGAFQEGFCFADSDPEGAEFQAAMLRRFFLETESPRLAAAAIRILGWNGPDFLSHAGPRAKPAPSYVDLLDEFTKGRNEDPTDLTTLKRRFARREQARVGTEKRLRAEYGEHVSSDTGGSPVFDLLPKKPGLAVNWKSLVARWTHADPDHLYDPVIHYRLTRLPAEELAAVARAYPREEFVRLLKDAPGRYRLRGRAKLGNDGTGAMNRSRVLDILGAAPERSELLLTPGLTASFPPQNRREAGRLLHLLPPTEKRSAALTDEETSAGFLTAAIELPRGEEIDVIARVVSGLQGSDLVRRRIADWADQDLRYRLGPEDDEPWPPDPRELSGDLRAHLIRVLREAADPALAWIAARILSMSGRDADFAALLFANPVLDLESASRGHPLAELADRIDSPMRLGYFLMFLRRAEASPRVRADVFSRVVEFNWLGRLPAKERETALRLLYDFVVREVPKFDADLPEAMLLAIIKNTPESMAHRSRAAFEAALPRLPLDASRVRLRHLATDGR